MGYYHGHNTGATSFARDIKKKSNFFSAASVMHLGDNSITTKVLEGDAAVSILKYCEGWKAGLIVMSSHRHHGLDRLLITLVSRHVFAESTIPVLTVPTGDVFNHDN